MNSEPMYVEKVDSYLIDQFHQGLFEVTEGLWGEVMHGEWYCHLEFFEADLILRADKNLYEAKRNGKNQVLSGLPRHSSAGAG